MEFLKISAFVFLGGGFGSLARLALSHFQSQWIPDKFPIGTLLANLFACFILGLVLFLSKDRMAGNLWIKYFLAVGFCGGFSTFSTFGLETVQLIKSGFIVFATANILISLSLGFMILWLFIKA
ncbi:MAG: fluoride efflux transporter CrcB [Crocinitomicaceae bacterium]